VASADDMMIVSADKASSSLDRSSPDPASPPAKRQQTKRAAARAIPGNKRPGRGHVAESWPPPATTDRPLLSKTTQTELPDPSTLADSLSMVIELKDDESGLNADEQRRLQEILR